MSTAEVKDVFDYFHGGREGIKRRFSDLIIGKLREITAFEAAEIENFLDSQGLFAEIVTGRLEVITWEVVEPLIVGLDINMEDALGEFLHWDDEAAEHWVKRMSKQQCFLMGTRQMPATTAAKMFVGITAASSI